MAQRHWNILVLSLSVFLQISNCIHLSGRSIPQTRTGTRSGGRIRPIGSFTGFRGGLTGRGGPGFAAGGRPGAFPGLGGPPFFGGEGPRGFGPRFGGPPGGRPGGRPPFSVFGRGRGGGPPGSRGGPLDFAAIRRRNGGLPIWGGACETCFEGMPQGMPQVPPPGERFRFGPPRGADGRRQNFSSFIEQRGAIPTRTGFGGIFGDDPSGLGSGTGGFPGAAGPRAAGSGGDTTFMDPTDDGRRLQIVPTGIASTIRSARAGGRFGGPPPGRTSFTASGGPAGGSFEPIRRPGGRAGLARPRGPRRRSSSGPSTFDPRPQFGPGPSFALRSRFGLRSMPGSDPRVGPRPLFAQPSEIDQGERFGSRPRFGPEEILGRRPEPFRIPQAGRPTITQGGRTSEIPPGMTFEDLGFTGSGAPTGTIAASVSSGFPSSGASGTPPFSGRPGDDAFSSAIGRTGFPAGADPVPSTGFRGDSFTSFSSSSRESGGFPGPGAGSSFATAGGPPSGADFMRGAPGQFIPEGDFSRGGPGSTFASGGPPSFDTAGASRGLDSGASFIGSRSGSATFPSGDRSPPGPAPSFSSRPRGGPPSFGATSFPGGDPGAGTFSGSAFPRGAAGSSTFSSSFPGGTGGTGATGGTSSFAASRGGSMPFVNLGVPESGRSEGVFSGGAANILGGSGAGRPDFTSFASVGSGPSAGSALGTGGTIRPSSTSHSARSALHQGTNSVLAPPLSGSRDGFDPLSNTIGAPPAPTSRSASTSRGSIFRTRGSPGFPGGGMGAPAFPGAGMATRTETAVTTGNVTGSIAAPAPAVGSGTVTTATSSTSSSSAAATAAGGTPDLVVLQLADLSPENLPAIYNTLKGIAEMANSPPGPMTVP